MVKRETREEKFKLNIEAVENIPFVLYLRTAGVAGTLEGLRFTIDMNIDSKVVIFHIGERQFTVNTIDLLQEIYRAKFDKEKDSKADPIHSG